MATKCNTSLNLTVNSNSYFEQPKQQTQSITSSLLGRAIRLNPYQLYHHRFIKCYKAIHSPNNVLETNISLTWKQVK